MHVAVFLALASLSLIGFVGTQSVSAFPINREKFTHKEKLPPPVVIRDKWAVLIGISKYRDPHIEALKSTTANVAILSKTLKDPNAGRFADDHVVTLYGQQATKKYIEFLLTEDWLIKKALPNDLIVVYVCGRAAFTNDDAILCTYDTNVLSLEPSGMSLNNVLAEIHRRTQSKNIVCIADLAPMKEGVAPNRDVWRNLANSAKVSILAANLPGMPSYQYDAMGTIFTGFVNDALQQVAGATPLEQLAMHVYQGTEAEVHSRLNKEQYPQFILSPENHELGAVSIGVPIKGTQTAQSRVAIGHPLDTLALDRPDLLPHEPHRRLVAAAPAAASTPSISSEGAKEIPHKPVAPAKAAARDEDDDDDVQDIDYSAYMTKMKKDIQSKWIPPKGIEARKVSVVFSIHRDGSITDGTIAESSGVESVDKSALEALQAASPIDPLPKGAPKSVQIRYQFDWKVN